METRFKMLTKSKPEDAKRLWQEAQHDVEARYRLYEYLAQRKTRPSRRRQTKERTAKLCDPSSCLSALRFAQHAQRDFSS